MRKKVSDSEKERILKEKHARFPVGPISAPPVPAEPIIPHGEIVETDKSKISTLEKRVAELELQVKTLKKLQKGK